MRVNLVQEIERHVMAEPIKRLGIAVSGGSDSLALLHLTRELVESRSIRLFCVTVNHGLRDEAQAEADLVAAVCQALDVPHETLHWRGWDGQGNTQAQARDARYDLMAKWAGRHKTDAVALGHTLDDQAETVLMRLARGAGVDGLSAMAVRRVAYGVTWIRPLLGVRRNALRAYLEDKGQRWIDDPSNDDPGFDRIKIRQALGVLGDLGVGAEQLAKVAQNMQEARQALQHQVLHFTRRHVTELYGALRIDWPAFQGQPPDIRRRLLVSALQWISGSPYTPRGRAVAHALHALAQEASATLDGCRMRVKKDALWVAREYRVVAETVSPPGTTWDSRWVCNSSSGTGDFTIAALGDKGLRECADWRELGVPREVLIVTPAVWKGDILAAAPLVNPGGTWQASRTCRSAADFDAAILH